MKPKFNAALLAQSLFGGLTGRQAAALVKLNLRNTGGAYIAAGIFLLIILAQLIIQCIIRVYYIDYGQQTALSIGSAPLILLPLCALRIARRHYKRIISLGGKRQDFFYGSLLTYIVLAGAVSLLNCVMYYVYDGLLLRFNVFDDAANFLDTYNWMSHGIIIAFFQQWVYLFFIAVFIHSLAFCQGSLAGWIVDAALVTLWILSHSVDWLKRLTGGFWHIITAHPHATVQLASCAAAALAVYWLHRPLLNRKEARA